MMPTGPCPAKIMIVGEFPTVSESAQPFPFTGTLGWELGKMLSEAQILMGECFITYVLLERPPGGDLGSVLALKKKDITPAHLPVYAHMALPLLTRALARLAQEINSCNPNIIIALGNTALWALTGEMGITSWRGSLLECKLPGVAVGHTVKVLPTYNPTWLHAQYHLRPIAVHDMRQAKRHSTTDVIVRTVRNFVIRPTFEQVRLYFDYLEMQLESGQTKLAVDLETRAGHIACVAIATSKHDAICIPFMCKESAEGYWTAEEECEIVWRLLKILPHRNALITGQNFLYDSQYIYRWWLLFLPAARDTMIEHHVCFSQMQKGLDFLSSMYCEDHVYWKDDGKEWDYGKPEEEYWAYNCMDAVRTFEADDTLQNNIDQMGLREQCDFQMRLIPAVLRTMLRGVRCDQKRRNEFALELSVEIANREQWILDVVGRPLNPKSPKQMTDFFYEELRQKVVKDRQSGNPTCNNEALQKIKEREVLLAPLCNRILELRSLGVFLSTFVSAPLDIDNRIRSSYNIAGTETYRFSSSQNAFGTGLNMQNIPKGGEDDNDGLVLPNVRSLFIPDPGYTFFDIDLDSADLRIVVWESDAVEMKQMFAEGLKPYVEVAKEYYYDPSITKHHKAYPVFKALCHGTNYLGTSAGLAPRVGLLVHEVERVQKWYFGKFPQIKKWQERIIDQVTKRRMVSNVFGYRTYFMGRLEGTVFNQAIAWIPQSSVGILINKAYVAIHEQVPEVQVLLQVHDSLAGQFPTHLKDWAVARIVEKSRVALPYPEGDLIIPVGVKASDKSWGHCG